MAHFLVDLGRGSHGAAKFGTEALAVTTAYAANVLADGKVHCDAAQGTLAAT